MTRTLHFTHSSPTLFSQPPSLYSPDPRAPLNGYHPRVYLRLSIQRAPLLSIHSRALLGAIHPLWVSFSELRSCFFTREHCSGFSTRSGSTHFYFTREHCFRALHPLWVYTLLRIILEHHCTQREHQFATIQVVHRLYLQWLTNTRRTISVASMGFGPTSVAHISSLR